MPSSDNKFYSIKTLGNAANPKLAQIEDYVVGQEMDDWRTKYGHPAKKGWPSDATIVLRKTSGRTLTDLLGTIKNTVFASPALREVIARHCKDVEIEYLPFELVDHRQRTISKDYVIVNPLGTLDCLDVEASDILWDEDEPNKALAVNVAVFSAKKLKKAPGVVPHRRKARLVQFSTMILRRTFRRQNLPTSSGLCQR